MTTLRNTVNFVTFVAALGLVGGLGAFHLKGNRSLEDVDELTADVREFEQMIKLRAATKDVELNGRGWPLTIDPGWFKGDAPRNPLLSPDRDWVEIAPPGDAHLCDPRIRIALDERFASFWYNPYQGIVRARVPMKINDSMTLELYNTVNGTALPSIFRVIGEPDPTDRPLAPESAPADAVNLPDAPPAPPPEAEAPTPEPEPTPHPVDETDSLDPTKPAEPAPAPPEVIIVPSSPAFPNVAPPPKPKKGRGK